MKTHNAIATIEEVLVTGNLASLNPAQRLDYYNKLCETLKLNPLTKPFEYITLNGKLTMYARKDCTDQLRKVHGISIYKVESKTENDVHIVTAYARDANGREDVATGAVSIGGIKGEALANAYMKAETKSKRRVTLSIGGLGMLDETEIESIKTVNPRQVSEPVFNDHQISKQEDDGDYVTEDQLHKTVCVRIESISSEDDLEDYEDWKKVNRVALQSLIASRPELAGIYQDMFRQKLESFASAKVAAAKVNNPIPTQRGVSVGERLNGSYMPFDQSQLAERLTFS